MAPIHSFPGISGLQHIFPQIPSEASGRILEKHPDLQGTISCSAAPGPVDHSGGVHPRRMIMGTLVLKMWLLNTFLLQGREKKAIQFKQPSGGFHVFGAGFHHVSSLLRISAQSPTASY